MIETFFIEVEVTVLHEAEGHIVTVEGTTGGKLIEAEDNMTRQVASVTVTFRYGRVAPLENKTFISGS